jgi:hypothetical protein
MTQLAASEVGCIASVGFLLLLLRTCTQVCHDVVHLLR